MKKKQVITNFLWRFAECSGAQCVEFLVSIILARILEPEAYGTIALVIVMATVLQVFVDSGFGNALIQKKDADDLDFSSVFYFNIVICVVIYLIIFCLAPYIAAFYGKNELTAVIRVLCLVIVISGVKNIQQAYVSRNLQFKKFFRATISGTIVSAIAGITAAISGMGVWALVIQKLTNMIVDTLVLWWTVRWRPALVFSWERLKGLYSYGWKIFLSSLLDTAYNNLRQMIIGKMYSTVDLAYYEKGKQFPNLIVGNINTSINSVLLPVMANEQDNKENVKSMTRMSIKISSYIMAPIMMGLAFTAPTVVELVLTEKWLSCVPFMRIFCVTYMFYPIHAANLNAIKAMGRSDLFLKLEVAKKIVGLIILVISMPHGVLAMAYSLLLSSLSSQIINSWPNKELLNYGYIEQIKDIMPNILLAVFMGVCVSFFNVIELSRVVVLLIQICCGILLYFGCSALFKLESFIYIKNSVKTYLRKKS